jgi:TonB-dependent SusC/RagA subfamily outer membrane receptor
MVDGKESADALNTVNPNDIESINVLKGDAAIKQFGDRGKNGVVIITLKKVGAPVNNESSTGAANQFYDPKGAEARKPRQQQSNKVFEKAEVDASVNLLEWRKFLEQNLQPVIEEVAKKGAPAGTYTAYMRFIVEEDGSLSNPTIVQDPGYGIGEKFRDLIYKSPKWEPAIQNGIRVRAYHTQPITLVIAPQ